MNSLSKHFLSGTNKAGSWAISVLLLFVVYRLLSTSDVARAGFEKVFFVVASIAIVGSLLIFLVTPTPRLWKIVFICGLAFYVSLELPWWDSLIEASAQAGPDLLLFQILNTGITILLLAVFFYLFRPRAVQTV